MPRAIVNARANRAFLTRAARYLVVRGVRQFIELGAGLPGDDGFRGTAQAIDPAVRVLYVDHVPLSPATCASR